MRLEELGYNEIHEAFRIEQKLDRFDIGRVIAEHKERYIVKTSNVEIESEITGNMRFSGVSREDFPAVGDWVVLKMYDDDSAIIYNILPRLSIIKRQAVGQFGEIQIIATNIDFAFLVQAADRDFNINRLERYLTICYSSNVSPIILLNKIDLIEEQTLNEILDRIKTRIKDVPIIAFSNKTQQGYDTLKKTLKKGKTYCMLGSSGVGKSTLLNNLSGRIIMKTNSISQSSRKGRHITSHRELIVLENGGILVDNPGMREVGIVDTTVGLETTFDKIISFSNRCKFKNCTHTGEVDCYVREAVEKGEIEKSAYENYLRMEREKTHFESTVIERHKKDKEFGKMIKNYKKGMRKNKY